MQMNDMPRRFPSAYNRDPDLQMLVRRYSGRPALGSIAVETVARAAHRATPWAGRPIPWDEISEHGREEGRAHALWALEHVDELQHLHDDICCREHGTHATPHRGCILR